MRMEKLLLEYLPILIFIGLAGVMGGALIVVPLIMAPSPSQILRNCRPMNAAFRLSAMRA